LPQTSGILSSAGLFWAGDAVLTVLSRRVLGVCLLAVVSFVERGAFAAPAAVDGRITTAVAPIIIDDSIKSRLPPAFSATTLRRELENALDSTQLISVVAREHGVLDAVLSEMVLSHRRSMRAVPAQSIIAATVEDVTLGERRRTAPRNKGQVLVSMAGAMSLRVVVLRASDGFVQAEIPIDETWAGRSRLDDATEGDSGAHKVDGSPADFVALCETVARSFATRVLNQIAPVQVLQRSDDQLFLSRGEDAGYRIGQTLRVIRQGAEIRHPVTGQILGHSETTIGEIQVTEVQPRLTIAKILSSREQITPGAIVREDLPPATAPEN
jgi:hypothetical protein